MTADGSFTTNTKAVARDRGEAVIPSYDDLTPGIPGVVDSKTVLQLALFLGVGSLYACLRSLDKFPNSPISKFPNPTDPLLAIARDFSPRVMVASGIEVLLDVSGLGRLIGEPPAIGCALAHAMVDAGLAASVALAPTQTAARLLATQSPDYPIARLPDLPVTLLQPLEAGLKACATAAMNHRERARPYEILERWGIETLGDLAALPAAELSSRLGRRGVVLQRLARGLDPRPFVPDAGTPRFRAHLELEWPIETLEPLSFVFARLLEPLSASLERADRGAVAVRLDLRLTDRSTHGRVLPLPAPMRDARVLRTLLLLDLESHPPFGGASEVMIDVVAIELDPAPARITQFSLLQRALPSPETVSTLIARLSALVGESRVGSAVLVDSHRPDAFEMERYAPERRGAEGAQGAGGGLVLRRQRTPPAIRVSVEHGRPVHVAATRRGVPYGAVMQAAGPWRTSGGWWTEGGPVPPKPSGEGGWNRDEWDVALASGAVCRIFQDRTTERWFLDGTYD